VHLTINPPSAPKRGKKIGPEVGRTSQGLAPQKVVDFWLASFVQSRCCQCPLWVKSVICGFDPNVRFVPVADIRTPPEGFSIPSLMRLN
jgi:hypothetical protein